MQESHIRPTSDIEELLYPSIDDPQFVEKLLHKREFAETKQPSIQDQIESGTTNFCEQSDEFELTAVQNFVSRLINPDTPYHSALLYHGVGVGKTCAAIGIAEGFLARYPREKVLVIAPTNVLPEFERNIFNPETLIMGRGFHESEAKGIDVKPNRINGCTGDTYLSLTGTLFEPEKETIIKEIRAQIKRRYEFMGYQKFAISIRRLFPLNATQEMKTKRIRDAFSGRLIIIDEAHNLRDNPNEPPSESLDDPGGKTDLSDIKEGKMLTPYLRSILMNAEGVSLVLLTGTPMYNEYSEIIFLLNLLLLNEKRPTHELLVKEKLFGTDGKFLEGGRERIGEIANRYVSFMRGENPLTFPIRLRPMPSPKLKLLTTWPTHAPNGAAVSPVDITKIRNFNLPIVECAFTDPALAEQYQQFTTTATRQRGGLGLTATNDLIQAGNWIYPTLEDRHIEERIREPGFDAVFDYKEGGFAFNEGFDRSWLQLENLGKASPKSAILLRHLQTARGVVFVYSRFIKVGGLSLALALEANGYSPHGKSKRLLHAKIPDGELQCALCERKKGTHKGATHNFIPARYAFLSGDTRYSADNKGTITAEQAKTNSDGRELKVVIGSQVAGEGINLKFVREIWIFDPWFHLNKLEQIIGRGIRFCSHSLLDPRERNCTVYLLCNMLSIATRESVDLYTYRRAIQKAADIGQVTRTLKEYAIDCNLNHDAILISGLTPVEMIDSQGVVRPSVNRNDVPYSALCDWDTCDTYTCTPQIDVKIDTTSESTYTEYTARWQEQKLLERVRQLFRGATADTQQAFIPLNDFVQYFQDISQKSRSMLLQSILHSKSFFINLFGKQGRIIYKNGYFLFQPLLLRDESIPLALRVAPYPTKRESYVPTFPTSLGTAPPVANAATAPPVLEKARPNTEAAAAAEPPETPLSGFWKTIVNWANEIRHANAVAIAIPNELQPFLALNADIKNRLTQHLQMIPWLYLAIPLEWRSILADVVCEVVWDEFLSAHYQRTLFKQGIVDKAVFSEQILHVSDTTAFRYVDTNTGELKYSCDAEECTPAQKTVFENADPLKDISVNSTTTGFLYGFLVPKKGSLIFKTNDFRLPRRGAAVATDKVQKGQECAISSAVPAHRKKLIELGAELKQRIGTTVQMEEAILASGARKIENATRTCFMMDLLLRCMDKANIGGKRWFYRSVASSLTGHKGTYAKE